MSPTFAQASALWRHPEYRRGIREMTGISLGIGAWGLVTGVAMVNSGLGVPLSLFMSLIVFAGSSQLASLPLIAAGAPIWVVWATAFCVNLRFVIFSAQWRPYFGHFPLRRRLALGYFCADLNYVMFMRRFPDPHPGPGQVPYFLGGVTSNWVAWQVPSITGILLADRVPIEWGLGFAGTLALMGLTYSLLVDRATWVAAGVAGTAAVAAFAMPLRMNIVVAIAAAVAVGLLMDRADPPAPRRVARIRHEGSAPAAGDPRTSQHARVRTMSTWESILTICGLAVITLVTRSFFMLPRREIPLPTWLRQGLRYAPLAALAAIVVPEVVMTQGRLIDTWRDPRLFAVLAASAWYWWRRDILGTILSGTAVMLLLRLGLGW